MVLLDAIAIVFDMVRTWALRKQDSLSFVLTIEPVLELATLHPTWFFS